MFLRSATSTDVEWQKHSITTGNLDLHVFERVLQALKRSPRFTLMTRVFCLKMKLQNAWSPSIAAQSFKTHRVLWYNLTIAHCGIYKALLHIIFVIFTLFSSHFVSIKLEKPVTANTWLSMLEIYAKNMVKIYTKTQI